MDRTRRSTQTGNGRRPSGGRLRILLVDDDVRCLDSLGDFLERDGHSIQTAKCGTEALDIAKRLRGEERRIELSILDFHVPDMSGLETYARLLDFLPGLAAIFISGECSADLERSVRRAGGLVLIPKPLDLAHLRREIDVIRKRLRIRGA